MGAEEGVLGRLRWEAAVEPATRDRIVALICSWDTFLLGSGEITVTPLLGGANNRNFVVRTTDSTYALRIASPFSEQLAVDRESAYLAQQDAAAVDVAPAVLAAQLPQGHQLSQFLEGEVLNADSLHDAGTLAEVALCLRRLHAAPTRCRDYSPFQDIRQWNGVARSNGVSFVDGYEELLTTVAAVEQVFAPIPLEPVFCHNDTVPQNFIAGSDAVRLVDWDYAGKGLATFELGSFCCTADLEEDEQEHVVRAYGVVPTREVLARLGLMGFVAAVREIAWVQMAAPILTGTTGVSAAWYDEYLTSNTRRALTLRQQVCTSTCMDTAGRWEPGSAL